MRPKGVSVILTTYIGEDDDRPLAHALRFYLVFAVRVKHAADLLGMHVLELDIEARVDDINVGDLKDNLVKLPREEMARTDAHKVTLIEGEEGIDLILLVREQILVNAQMLQGFLPLFILMLLIVFHHGG